MDRTSIILMQLGDEYIEEYFIAPSREELVRVVGEYYECEMRDSPEVDYLQRELDRLLRALAAHSDWSPGYHNIETILWPYWVLLISNDKGYGLTNV